MMTAAALKAPLAAEPMLDALRALTPRTARAFDDDPFRVAAPDTVGPAIVAPSKTVVTRPISWVAPTENLWLLSIRNFGLTLATFGVYHFWGRAEARRHVVNAVRVNDQPVDYTGTGKEAFFSFVFGAIIAVGIVSAFLLLIKGNGVAAGGIEGIRGIRWERLTISLPLMFLLGSVVYRKRSHLLRRTWIGGQRFELSGHAWSYAWQHFWTAFLVPLTAGLAAPWRASRLEARKITEMRYGAFAFKAAPDLGQLYKAYAALWLGGGFIYVAMLVVLAQYIGPELLAAAHGLTLQPLLSRHVIEQGLGIAALGLVPVGLLLMIYNKAWLEHQISSIAFPTGRLRLKMPAMRYLGLSLNNAALKLATLGALAPVADARYLRFVIDHVTVEGHLDLPQPRS